MNEPLPDFEGLILDNWQIVEKMSKAYGSSDIYLCRPVGEANKNGCNHIFKVQPIVALDDDWEERIQQRHAFLQSVHPESGILQLCDGWILKEKRVVAEVYPRTPHGSLLDCLLSPENRNHLPAVTELIEKVAGVVATALNRAHLWHSGALFHRDVKASNILVTGLKKFDILLGDFGNAKPASPSSANTDYNKTHPRWNSAPDKELSAKSDFYSLGITLLEVAALRDEQEDNPFTGVNRNDQAGDTARSDINARKLARGAYMAEISRLPQRFWSLVAGLLIANPADRFGFVDLNKHLANEGEAANFDWYQLFPGIDKRFVHSDDNYYKYPRDLVASAIKIVHAKNAGESADEELIFNWFKSSHSYAWIVQHALEETTGHQNRYDAELAVIHEHFKSAATPDAKRLLFYNACFLIDPLCPLPLRSKDAPMIRSLGELIESVACVNETTLCSLRESFFPVRIDNSEVTTLVESWIEKTQASRSYWAKFYPDVPYAKRTLQRLKAARARIQNWLGKWRTCDDAALMVLRHAALQVSFVNKMANGLECAPLLSVRSILGVFVWKGVEAGEIRNVIDLGNAANLLLAETATGDHLRRSGALGAWLDALSEFDPAVKGLGLDSAFAVPQEDRLLSFLLGWEILARKGMASGESGRKLIESAIQRETALLHYEGLARWFQKTTWLAELVECCHPGAEPREVVKKIMSLRDSVDSKFDSELLQRLIPMTGSKEVSVVVLMVCLALHPNAHFDEALSLLVPEMDAPWWSGLGDAKEIGEWMLRPGNAAKADQVRRSGVVQVSLIFNEKRGTEAEKAGLLAPAWLEDLGIGNAELTTRYGALLAGKGGPEMEITYLGPSKDDSRILKANNTLLLAPMKTRQGTRMERFGLQNVEKELPGTLCCAVSIGNQRSIFGDPVLENSKDRFVRIGEKLVLSGNTLIFEVPINSTEGLVSGSAKEEAVLTIQYNHLGSAEWKTLSILLRCPVEVNHPAIRLWGLIGMMLGAGVFGYMGWWLSQISAASLVTEPRFDGGVVRISGAEHWWRRWRDRPEENLLPWGGAIEPESDPVPGYFDQATWGLCFLFIVLMILAWAMLPKKKMELPKE